MKPSERERQLRAIPERDVQATLVAALKLYGYRVFTVRQSAAPVGRNGRVVSFVTDKGFPDIFAVGGIAVAIEVKRETGKTTPEQDEWLRDLATAGVKTFVARPSNLDEILKELA